MKLKTKQIINLLLIAIAVILIPFIYMAVDAFYSLDLSYPSKQTEAEWEKNFKEVIVGNHSGFKGHWVNIDTAAYIFSYQYPEQKNFKSIIAQIKKNLPEFELYEKRDNEVALRQPVTYSRPDGYDEYRIIDNPKKQRVFILFANLDSEMDQQESLENRLREYAETYSNGS